MAEKNIVMDSPEMLVAAHGITPEEIQNADSSGFVGTRTIDNVGEVKYFITVRGTVQLPNQQGDRT